MKLIAHRRNKLDELRATPRHYGVEVDIRSQGNELTIHHDPYADGGLFIPWIDEYQHGTLILNVKEEGLEARLIELMRARGIDDYFFLDQSFPFLVKWANAGERHCAVCMSEYESVSTALSLAGRINWVWVNCYSRFPLTEGDARMLHDAGFKICLASPELHGHDAELEIPALKGKLRDEDIRADAVCTKRMDLWQ